MKNDDEKIGKSRMRSNCSSRNVKILIYKLRKPINGSVCGSYSGVFLSLS